MDDLEYNYELNIEPSPIDRRDWILEDVLSSDFDVNPVLDYRSELEDIRDQGSQGTCAAQTVACMKEWQEKQDVKWYGYMSPQFVYNHRKNQDGSGMYSRDVMKILHKIGICPESKYPYGKIESPNNIDEDVKETALNYVIDSYASVNTIDGLKKSLIKNGPCYIAFPVYNYSDKFWKRVDQQVFLGGHAVCVVGYTKDSFIIRNSWGDKWGDNGYTYYPFNEWGSHWEVWSTVDADTYSPRVVSWWRKIIWLLRSLF
jgi:hypothetical protein